VVAGGLVQASAKYASTSARSTRRRLRSVHAARAFATAAAWLPRPLATTARRTAPNTDIATSCTR
jgi:hypothetical protein